MNKKMIILLFIVLSFFLTGCEKPYNRSEEVKVEGGLPIYQQLLLLYEGGPK